MKRHNVTARHRSLVTGEQLDHLTMGPPKNDSLSNKVFFGCTMTALDPTSGFNPPEYFNSDMINCDLRRLTYDRSVLRDFTFVNCNLTGTELARTLLEHVSFVNCNLTKINLTGSILRDVDIQSSTLTGAVFTRAYIDGLRVDADPEMLSSTLLRLAANFPGPLPPPYVHVSAYPHPAGPFVGRIPTQPVPVVSFSKEWAEDLAATHGLSLRHVATLLAEHQELSPNEITALVAALSAKS